MSSTGVTEKKKHRSDCEVVVVSPVMIVSRRFILVLVIPALDAGIYLSLYSRAKSAVRTKGTVGKEQKGLCDLSILKESDIE